MKTIKAHFSMSLEKLNSKKCYYCGGFGDYRDRNEKSQKSVPGDYTQHENKYIPDLGYVAIFECAKCHNLLFFRSHYEEEVDFIK